MVQKPYSRRVPTIFGEGVLLQMGEMAAEAGKQKAFLVCDKGVEAAGGVQRVADALERAGLTAEEVIHVGDSLDSDVLGAKNVGIEPILVDRAGKYSDTEVRRVGNLAGVLDYI